MATKSPVLILGGNFAGLGAAHLKGLPIADEVGFVVTDMQMSNPDCPEVYACGDAAALTVPLTVSQLGAIGHQETDVVGRHIAKRVGKMTPEEAHKPWMPAVVCIGDMGGGKAFYIPATSWLGGDIQELRMGHLPYGQKLAYKEMFFANHGRMPNWGLPLAEWSAETIKV